MSDQLTTNAEALRLFFTEDIYLVGEEAAALQTVPKVAQEAVNKTVEANADVAPSATVAKAPIAAPVSAVTFKHLGKNQKHILILVNDEQHDVSTEQGRELLRNIVKAIELTANDFALLNYCSTNNAGFTELTQFFSSKVVLAFGLTATQLGLQEQPQHVIIMQDNTQLILSSNLDALAADLNGKKTLWGSLKKLSIS